MSNQVFNEELPDKSSAKLVLYELKPGRWMVTRIEVPEAFRHQGFGTMLMEQACAWADEKGLPLIVHPDKHSDWPVVWLEEFDFRIQENGNMLRQAQKLPAAGPKTQ